MKSPSSKEPALKLWIATGLGIVLLLFSATVVFASDYLDPLFGAPNGYVSVDNSYSDSVVQNDGRILLSGNDTLTRLLPDGSVDTGFGVNGLVGTPSRSRLALTRSGDGNIVVAGACDLDGDGRITDISLTRLLPSGQPDPAFHGGATVCRPVNATLPLMFVNEVAIQKNGHILVTVVNIFVGDVIGGYSLLAGFDSNGNLDAAFGTNGIITSEIPPSLGGSSFRFDDLLVQENDDILILGTVSNWRDPNELPVYLLVLQLTSTGQYDPAFGTDGIFIYDDPANTEWGSRLAVQRSSRIIVAGQQSSPFLIGVTKSGELDASFGVSGITTFPEAADDVLVLADDSIVTAGDSLRGFLSNGAVDASFAGAGVAKVDFLGRLRALHTQPNGQIILVGEFPSISQTFVARLGQEFVPVPVFADVNFDFWSWAWIERLYAAGITQGCSDSPLSYCPESAVTRSEMAILLLRSMHGSGYIPAAPVGVFADVPTTHWAAGWIEQLFAEGITAGCGPAAYCPEEDVTRAQMAVFLLRGRHGSSYTPPSATGLFTDVPKTYWAAAWIEQLAAEGITRGCGAGTYCPDSPVTRAQMAVFLVRAFNLPASP